MELENRRVGIIGSGPSGLAAIKSCLEEGFHPVAFERTAQVGGTWVYREFQESKYPEAAAVYHCLKTNTSKAFFGYTDFPCPEEWTPFVSHQKCLKYFQDYAKHFQLSKYIRFNAQVLKLYPSDEYETTGQWRLRYQSDGEYYEEVFDSVMICTGVFAQANLPRYPQQEIFQGKFSTGNAYRKNAEYADKKILVVGSGISAGDIATDISNVAEKTYISSRKGFSLTPVIDSNGSPFDLFLGKRLVKLLPVSFEEWLLQRERYRKFRSAELGLASPQTEGPAPTGEIINDNFMNQVFCGRILPKPGIKKFTNNGVVFTDGSEIENLDVVMFCTGYHSTIPLIEGNLISETSGERDLYSLVFPVHLKHPTLACIGFMKNTSLPGSPITVLEMQTRWVAQIWSGKCRLPSKTEMLNEVAERRREEYSEYGKVISKVDAVRYMDLLAGRIGCYPSLARLLVTDPRLAVHMLFGPVVPATYRLVGPHKWVGARDAILNSTNTTFQGTQLKTSTKHNVATTFGLTQICIILISLLIWLIATV